MCANKWNEHWMKERMKICVCQVCVFISVNRKKEKGGTERKKERKKERNRRKKKTRERRRPSLLAGVATEARKKPHPGSNLTKHRQDVGARKNTKQTKKTRTPRHESKNHPHPGTPPTPKFWFHSLKKNVSSLPLKGRGGTPTNQIFFVFESMNSAANSPTNKTERDEEEEERARQKDREEKKKSAYPFCSSASKRSFIRKKGAKARKDRRPVY
mmetsp:Transcript_20100/g.40352  ORF Transcript_20100/g.40352 Transcript_20100/m.40352 type:complete len:214 (+) Transcript_20100:187-828(+)